MEEGDPMTDGAPTPKRLCADCRFRTPVYLSPDACVINGHQHCRSVNPRGLCTDFEPPPPPPSLLRDSPRAAGIVSVGLGAALVELLHWIGGML